MPRKKKEIIQEETKKDVINSNLKEDVDKIVKSVEDVCSNMRFNELRCNHSWWIENNVIKPVPYFLEKKKHCKAITEEDMAVALDLLKKITTIFNEQTRYQPSVVTYCRVLGISTSTFNNWSYENNDRGEMARKIQDYFKSILVQGMATGELNPVAGSFIGRTTLGMKENEGNQTNFNFFNVDKTVEDIFNEFSKNIKSY